MEADISRRSQSGGGTPFPRARQGGSACTAASAPVPLQSSRGRVRPLGPPQALPGSPVARALGAWTGRMPGHRGRVSPPAESQGAAATVWRPRPGVPIPGPREASTKTARPKAEARGVLRAAPLGLLTRADPASGGGAGRGHGGREGWREEGGLAQPGAGGAGERGGDGGGGGEGQPAGGRGPRLTDSGSDYLTEEGPERRPTGPMEPARGIPGRPRQQPMSVRRAGLPRAPPRRRLLYLLLTSAKAGTGPSGVVRVAEGGWAGGGEVRSAELQPEPGEASPRCLSCRGPRRVGVAGSSAASGGGGGGGGDWGGGDG